LIQVFSAFTISEQKLRAFSSVLANALEVTDSQTSFPSSIHRTARPEEDTLNGGTQNIYLFKTVGEPLYQNQT
jgi:hypothetical protein